MIQTLVRNWWLLALCGLLHAAIAAMYLVMQATDGPVLSPSWVGTLVLVGKLAMAAGACTIAAAIWRARNGSSWPLALNCLALVALGVNQIDLTRIPDI